MEINYAQPDFYHFSEDSILLARFAGELALPFQRVRCLDLAAGCGVVGLETCLRRKDITALTLVEMQIEFLPYLTQNCAQWDGISHIVHSTLGNFHAEEKFELVVGNLPYFNPGQGRAASDIRRQLARHFSVDSTAVALELVQRVLAPAGAALLLLHEQQLATATALKSNILWSKKQVHLVHFCR